MPYQSVSDLPANLQKILPIQARSIFMNAYNNALKQYDTPKKGREIIALKQWHKK
ncbi:MAG: ChaB family protein [Gammaproteobacteria bacterium]|nr:ChaB family protein [Gammaproteobacteria bacterium]